MRAAVHRYQTVTACGLVDCVDDRMGSPVRTCREMRLDLASGASWFASRPGGARVDGTGECSRHVRGAGSDAAPSMVHRMIGGRCGDFDDPLSLHDGIEPAKAHLNRIVADHQKEIAALCQVKQDSVGDGRKAGTAHGQWVVFRDQSLAFIGRQDRGSDGFSQPQNMGTGICPCRLIAGEDQRSLGAGQIADK